MRSTLHGFAALSVALCGCEAVPTLNFVSDDAGTQQDAGGSVDAGVDADAPETGASCTGPKPATDAECCGRNWCVGSQCRPGNGRCNDCETRCAAPASLCCPQGNGVTCETTTCP